MIEKYEIVQNLELKITSWQILSFRTKSFKHYSIIMKCSILMKNFRWIQSNANKKKKKLTSSNGRQIYKDIQIYKEPPKLSFFWYSRLQRNLYSKNCALSPQHIASVVVEGLITMATASFYQRPFTSIICLGISNE